MRVTNDEVKTMIDEYYNKHHPELKLTQRILNNLIPIVYKGLDSSPEDMTVEQAMPSVHNFLEKENILSFIRERQPNTEPIPSQVIDSLKTYFKDFLPNTTICHVYRKSNHMDDRYLYSVTAKNNDGTYCCWSSWNAVRESLNYGHYGLGDEQQAINILQDLFNDITDEPEKYGMQQNSYCEEENKQQDEQNENKIVSFNRHKGR